MDVDKAVLHDMKDEVFYGAVLGSPIDHSKSPLMHRTAYQYLDVPIQYDRFEVTEADADAFMASLTQRYGSTKHLVGFSVTMPLKAALVPHMRILSERVKQLGVLNTVVYDHIGNATGYNTDVDGIRHALASATYDSWSGGSMGILGAGGTASAAIAAAADMNLASVVLYVRNPARAQDNVDVAKRCDLGVEVRQLSEFAERVQQHSAVVATLPARAADWLADQLPTYGLPPLLDVIYEPWPTALAAAWRVTGAPIASGLDMLLYQGVEQVKLFTQKVARDHRQIDWEGVTHQMAIALGLDPQ